MKRHFKWLLVLFTVLIVLSVLIITLGRGDTSKNRGIARDLLEAHSRWETNGKLVDLNYSNMPFHGYAGAGPHTIYVMRNLLYTPFEEYYWMNNSTSNVSEWTLYHGWYCGQRQLTKKELLTIVETNAAKDKVSP